MFGHLVVRQSPSKEPHSSLYDEDLPEHSLLVHDWFVRETPGTFAQHHHSDGTNKPETVLINGENASTTVVIIVCLKLICLDLWLAI